MVAAKKAHPYYSYNKILSYDATYNMIVGVRGLGKTYGLKVRAIKQAIKKNEMFIYLRRNKTELKAAKETFFDDFRNMYPDHEFKVDGYIIRMNPIGEKRKLSEWSKIGYFFALSTAQSLKSVSFPDVTLIIYDEFIVEAGAYHYLQNEVTIFNNFYSTVDRGQDKTKVFFLANSVSIMNPYMLQWDIQPDSGKEWIIKFNGFLVCHFPQSKDYTRSIYETQFGKFIQQSDPEYAAYAYENKFNDNTENLLGEKGYKAKYRYTIETPKGYFSVWYDGTDNQWYVQRKRPKQEIVFTMVSANMSTEKILINFSDLIMSSLRTYFRQGIVVFDKPSSRNIFAEIFKR